MWSRWSRMEVLTLLSVGIGAVGVGVTLLAVIVTIALPCEAQGGTYLPREK